MLSRCLLVLTAVSAVTVTTACGGGGGSSTPPPPTLHIDQRTLTFQASSPLGAAPATQDITGSVSGTITGTLYIVVVVSDPNKLSVSNFLVSGTTGRATVTVGSPFYVGAGEFKESLVVHACVNSINCASGELAGSPVTVQVSYTVGSTVQFDTVTPRVILSQSTPALILRGSGLKGATSVSIGGLAATAVSAVSDSEIHLMAPALSAGSQAVSVNGGAIAFTGALDVVDEPPFSSTLVPWPSVPDGLAKFPIRLLYGPAQRVLFAVAGVTGNTEYLYRFAYSNGWGLTDSRDINLATDVELSPDGAQLYILYSDHFEIHDAATLALIRSVPRLTDGFFTYQYLGTMAIMNDGMALLPWGSNHSAISGYAPLVVMSLKDFSFYRVAGDATVSEDKRAAVRPDGSEALLESEIVYSSSSGLATWRRGQNPYPGFFPRWLNRTFNSATSLIDLTVKQVNFADNTTLQTQDLGVIASPIGFSVANEGAVSDGRAFAVDNGGFLHVWDVGNAPLSGQFTELATPLDVSQAMAGSQFFVQRSLSGHTDFVANQFGIAVVAEH